MPTFETRLARVVTQEITGCTELLDVERLSGGASQETYRLTVLLNGVETPLAMRRTPGGEYVEALPSHPGLDVEALLMQSAKAVGVPEPEVYHVLTREDDLGDGFIMEWIEGEALGARITRDPQFDAVRPTLARACGEILARIHGIDLDQSGLRSRLAELPPKQFLDQMLERYHNFNVPQPMIDYTGRWLQENLPKTDRLTLVHNDFRAGNFMLTPDGISAVLDWEVAHIGDPMRDLGWICTNSWRFGSHLPVGGFGTYDDLFAGYEAESGFKVDPDHVKYWEVFGSFWWAIGCLGMAEHYRTGPDQSVERPAIGRRTSECQVDCVNLLIPGAVEQLEPMPGLGFDMPSQQELVQSVRDYLREDAMKNLQGRSQFLARVAGNSLDVVLRELALGGQHQSLEADRLRHYYGSTAPLGDLRVQLSDDLRTGKIPLSDATIQQHLRSTVVNQIAIDQPNYSGFKRAIGSPS